MLDQAEIDRLRAAPGPDGKLLIAGRWQDSADGATRAVVSPIDGVEFARIAEATAQDVDAAVAAARASFEAGVWANQAPGARKKVLVRIAELIEAHAGELAVLGVRDNGTEIGMALKAEPGSAAGTFRHAGESIDKIYGEIAPTAPGVLGLVHREPVGVVAAIVPWNFPLMIGAWKLAPALAAGNSVVLKPSEEASLSLLRMAELCMEAGLPEGVLNVVTGGGAGAGDRLARHMDVDVLAFTGSGGVGRKLLEASAQSNLKRVYLELGGKSPNVVFADAPDLDVAAKVAAMALFRNSGQVCVAPSRLLVENAIKADFAAAVATHARALSVGDPLDLSNEIGAVTTQAQMARIAARLREATDAGAQVLTGGNAMLENTGGRYLEPTVVDGVSKVMSLFQEEVFGPVLAITGFEGEDDAIALANATDYGLAAGLWTANLSRAHRLIRRMRAGVVHVNTYGGADVTVPLGGVKQSGNGVDKSLHAFDKYTDLKTAWIQL